MDGATMDKKKKLINEDVMTRNILNKLRTGKLIKEEVEPVQDAIAITNDPKFGQEVLKNQIDEFRATVDGGAQFNTGGSSPMDNPLIYYPSTQDLTFSGVIPSLNNLKWQFRLKDSDGTGLFIQTPENPKDMSGNDNQYSGLRLNKENLSKLNKLYGHYQNWKAQWEQSGGMLASLGKKED